MFYLDQTKYTRGRALFEFVSRLRALLRQVAHNPKENKRAQYISQMMCFGFMQYQAIATLTLEVLCIRKSASQCGNFACIAALDDCHDVMLIDCAMKNASVDAKNTIGLHLKF